MRAEEDGSGGPALPRPDEVLDTVGFFCPIPIIKTAARMRDMRRGQILEVLSDDRVILVDMPSWCKSAGHEYLGDSQQAGEIHLFVRKVGRPRRSGEQIDDGKE
ncbi:MAG TPA: sulfurtransferase TusA family protein [Candidatus Polarisedimenticolia bacterium]|jgi:tRNA 2-thiouridine synthesizing protein A|nr:sulfurtransferase TusA family protein [Candidatus Polarisedimenticolia bacterium]